MTGTDAHARLDSTMTVDLPLAGRQVTVAGSSGRAMVITGSLVGAGAVVTVIADDPTPYLSDLADRGLITLQEPAFLGEDFDSTALVFACTGSAASDESLAAEALRRGCSALPMRRPVRRRRDRMPPTVVGPSAG